MRMKGLIPLASAKSLDTARREQVYSRGRTFFLKRAMIVFEYKLDGTPTQYARIASSIRAYWVVRNKCLRLWMDMKGTTANDLQVYCSQLAKEFDFATKLNSQARQASAERAWFSIQRFYTNCKTKKPGKKGYPRFQNNNRSVEYKVTGWKLDPDGKHITLQMA